MARALNAAALCAFAAIGTARAECRFVGDEIANPFEPGCGDVVLTLTENTNSSDQIALGFPVPVPVDSLTPVDGFRTYASLFARHQALLTVHDEVAGEVVGQTVAGQDLWAYVIGDSDTTTPAGFPEGAALINGGIHAREWQSPEAATGLFEALVESKADASLGQYLIENFTLVVVPVHNVDGFVQTQRYPDRSSAHRDQPREGRMRRKNLRNPGTHAAIDDDLLTVADNFWGIDLNRNSAQGFGQNQGSSGSVTSLIYRGAAPESEPEVQALLAAARLAPESRLRLYTDLHSFGQVYLAPRTPNTRTALLTEQLAARMRAASLRPYAFAADPEGSTGIGTTADRMAFTYQIPSWTLELEPRNGAQDYGGLAWSHSGFVLPDSEVARMREDVTRMLLLGLYRQAGPPVAVAAQIRDLQADEVVYEAAWQFASPTARTFSNPVQRALVPGVPYRLWIAFDKPMRTRNAAGVVVPYRGQSTGAAVGQGTLEIPSLTGGDIALGTNAVWLDQPGGAPDGYLRYRDDAFAVDFTLPADLGITASTPAVLALSVLDMAEMALDAHPDTAVDWVNGSWQRYENALGVAGDTGGPDCSFKPFIALQPDATPPATEAQCSAATPPPPPPPPPPPSRSGGGGGALGFTLLLLLGAIRLLLHPR